MQLGAGAGDDVESGGGTEMTGLRGSYVVAGVWVMAGRAGGKTGVDDEGLVVGVVGTELAGGRIGEMEVLVKADGAGEETGMHRKSGVGL